MVVKFTSTGSQVTKQEFKERRNKTHQKARGALDETACVSVATTGLASLPFKLARVRKKQRPSCFSPPFSPRKENKCWDQENLDVQMSQIVFFNSPGEE